MSDLVMYILMNTGIGMSPGKMIAQGGHAVMESQFMTNPLTYSEWYDQHQKKIVLGIKSEEKLLNAKKKLEKAGLKVKEIRDLGLTEIEPNSLTAVAVEVVCKEDREQLFKRYSLLH